MAPIGNKKAISDVGVGVYGAEAALNPALLNVDINLPLINDKNFVTYLVSEKARLLIESEKLKAWTLNEVTRRI